MQQHVQAQSGVGMFTTALQLCDAYAALQGIRVFRMQRHEEFLRQMLCTVSQLYTKYVRADKMPPINMFYEQAAYQQFLKTTQQVADSVEVIIDLDSQRLPDVEDCKLFL